MHDEKTWQIADFRLDPTQRLSDARRPLTRQLMSNTTAKSAPARWTLAEIEARLRAAGWDQASIDRQLAAVIVFREQLAREGLLEKPGDIPS